MQAVSDEQLIRWVAEGDASCLGTLFERHHRGVYRYCLQMTRSPSASEDIVQEVFLKVLKYASTFRADGSCKSWIFNIARNVTFDHLRKMDSGDDAALPEDALIDHRSSEEAAASRESLQLVERALAEIPATAREVIWLAKFVFDDYDELARALDCTAGAARVRVHRAMQALHGAFTRMNGAPIDV